MKHAIHLSAVCTAFLNASNINWQEKCLSLFPNLDTRQDVNHFQTHRSCVTTKPIAASTYNEVMGDGGVQIGHKLAGH